MKYLPILLLLLVPVAQSQVTEQFTTEFYDVSPNSVDDIYDEVTQKHPDRESVEFGLAGLTKTNIKWEANYLFNKRICKMKDVNIQANITYIIPKLEDDYNKSYAVIRKFKKHQKKIITHENIHGSYARESALELETLILAIPNQDNCELLNKQIEKIAQESTERLRLRNKQLDLHDGKLKM